MTPRPTRIQIRQGGELELVAQPMAIGTPKRKKVAVSLRNVSRSGVGVRLPQDDAEAFLKNGHVTLRLEIAGRRVKIPGRIIWLDPSEADASTFDAGVRLHLEITDSLTRQAFARWLLRTASS